MFDGTGVEDNLFSFFEGLVTVKTHTECVDSFVGGEGNFFTLFFFDDTVSRGMFIGLPAKFIFHAKQLNNKMFV